MKARAKTPVIGIAGWKKSGKTTLTVRLIAELTRRGLKVASVKHAHHEFQVDDGETDSARHRRAGASEVAVIGGKRWAIVHELREEPEPNLEEILSWLSPSDIVIVEGYKTAAIPKIEARRQDQFDRRPLAPEDKTVMAIAADHEIEDTGLPVFHLDDISAIADFIERKVLSRSPTRPDDEPDDVARHTAHSR
ncbi:MAG: molybdopterin-guanine dinucleotide biosynthesis protein B [Hyphomicrobium sp.]|nr:molybdopterin-guanine dinucleotide biosynthesis protein B [Hyphomicrobium sp.]